MKITAIKAQIKRQDRVSIFVDGTYAFSLSQSQLLEEKLYSGLELDEARLDQLKKTSEQGKAYERIVRYITIRPRSQKEVQDYCRRKDISQEDCQLISQKLTRLGYLDDAAFARSWVESRHLTKATSLRKLQLELKQKGVKDEYIQAALANSNYNEREALVRVIAKKQKLSRYQDEQKFTRYLLQQGFSYDLIKEQLDDRIT